MPDFDFSEWMQTQSFPGVSGQIDSVEDQEIESALDRAESGQMLSSQDFISLLSKNANRYLEPMAQMATALTRKRFGNVIQIYAPLYLSNE